MNARMFPLAALAILFLLFGGATPAQANTVNPAVPVLLADASSGDTVTKIVNWVLTEWVIFVIIFMIIVIIVSTRRASPENETPWFQLISMFVLGASLIVYTNYKGVTGTGGSSAATGAPKDSPADYVDWDASGLKLAKTPPKGWTVTVSKNPATAGKQLNDTRRPATDFGLTATDTAAHCYWDTTEVRRTVEVKRK